MENHAFLVWNENHTDMDTIPIILSAYANYKKFPSVRRCSGLFRPEQPGEEPCAFAAAMLY
jgi:hypothetical protein